MGEQRHARPHQASVLLHPLVVGPAPLRLRVIGAEGTIGGSACICSVTNGWTCRWSRVSLPVRIWLLATLSCTARPFSPRLVGATHSQRWCPNRTSGDDL